MRYLLAVILLAFPVAEILLLIELAQRYGWWLFVYLVVIGYLGLQLVRAEKHLLSARMMQSITTGGNPLKTMLGSMRNVAAGLLLMLPGVISDIIAAILLLIPIQQPHVHASAGATSATGFGGYGRSPQAANDEVIEGEFTKIHEETKRDN